MPRNVDLPSLAPPVSLIFLLSVVLTGPLHAQSPQPNENPQAVEFFEKRIRPVLVERCHQCHSSQAPAVQGGLLLDTREGLRKGGNSGTALVPGDPEQSLLIKALRYKSKELQMPPGEPLTPEQVADFETWVKMGVPDPRIAKQEKRMGTASSHWSFQQPRKIPVPAMRNKAWEQNPTDAFILSALEAKGLQPSAPADKRTLLRRVTYDLIGLPPTPQETEAFLSDRRRKPSPESSTACWPRRTMASVGAATGWTWRATPTRRAAAETRGSRCRCFRPPISARHIHEEVNDALGLAREVRWLRGERVCKALRLSSLKQASLVDELRKRHSSHAHATAGKQFATGEDTVHGFCLQQECSPQRRGDAEKNSVRHSVVHTNPMKGVRQNGAELQSEGLDAMPAISVYLRDLRPAFSTFASSVR